MRVCMLSYYRVGSRDIPGVCHGVCVGLGRRYLSGTSIWEVYFVIALVVGDDDLFKDVGLHYGY